MWICLSHKSDKKNIANLAAEFQPELEAENIAAASVIQPTDDHLPNLQSIGATVFCRWGELTKPARYLLFPRYF